MWTTRGSHPQKYFSGVVVGVFIYTTLCSFYEKLKYSKLFPRSFPWFIHWRLSICMYLRAKSRMDMDFLVIPLIFSEIFDSLLPKLSYPLHLLIRPLCERIRAFRWKKARDLSSCVCHFLDWCLLRVSPFIKQKTKQKNDAI